MNSRQKGYVLLDTNLEEVQSAISRMLSIRLNDSKWKMIVKNRIYGSRDDAPWKHMRSSSIHQTYLDQIRLS